jgi:hypothetical protein
LCGSQPEWLWHQQGGHAGASVLHKYYLPLCSHCTLWWPSEVCLTAPQLAYVCACTCVHIGFFMASVKNRTKNIFNEKLHRTEEPRLLYNPTTQDTIYCYGQHAFWLFLLHRWLYS